MAHLTSSSCNRLRPVHSSKLSVFKPCSCTPPQSGSTVCQQARATGSTSSSELSSTRRHIIQKLALAATAATLDSANSLQHPPVSQAALVQFPASDLRNTYYLVTQRQCCSSPQVLLKWLQIEAKAGCSYSSVIQVRAGEGQCEADNYVLTNTVYKTSMNNGLSRQGKRQVARQILPALRELDACPDGTCWLWPSITQRSYQTAEILASLLETGYSRIVPEYSFLDPRGVGSLEGLSWDTASEQLREGDAFSPNWRPSRGTDGTPNESAQDVLVRVRQVMSICETQWSGANIVIISPDSDNLSILQAGILGIDLRQHHKFAVAPGEVRPLVTADEPHENISKSFTCQNPPKCF